MTMDEKEGDLCVAPAPLPAPDLALASGKENGMNDDDDADAEQCTSATDMENGTSSTSATADTPNPTPTTAEHEAGDEGSQTPAADSTAINTAATTTSTTVTATTSSFARSGFFSRIGGGDIRLGDVYDMAQKRATQMKEQALTEVEKLRQHQQQLQNQKKREEEQQENNKFVIPPSTGTLIIGDPVNNTDTDVITDAAGDDDAEKIGDSMGEKATSTTTMPKALPTSSLSLSTISSPLRDAFNLAKQKSTDAANQLIFPIDTFIAPKDSDDDDVQSGSSSSRSHSSASEYSSDSGDHSSVGDSHDASVGGRDGSKASNASAGRENNIDKSKHDDKGTKTNNIGGSNGKSGMESVAVATSTLTPTRIAEATNSVFTAAVGRYRRLKDSAASPLPPLPTKTKVIVGGADRVGGLRNFQLEDIINDQNATTAVLNPPANRLLPPSLPLSSKPPPGQKNLALQTDGQWTMASNRGPNAIVTVQASAHSDEVVGTSATPTFSRANPTTNGDATKPTGAGEAAKDGTSSANGMPPSGDTTPKPPQSKAPSRSSSYYEEAVRSVLKPGQRALFFGKGTMGVVLKPTYLASWRGKDGHDIVCPTASSKMGGVYIDSLIPGGHAELSGVVFVGDYVLKIGSVNVKNMTLEEVVNVIAEAKRPNIMVLTSEHDVKIVSEPAEDGRHVEAESNESGSRSMTATEKKCFVSPLDLVFGFVNKLEAEGEGSAESNAPAGAPSDDYQVKRAISRSSLLDNDEEEESIANDVGADSDEEVFFNSPEKGNSTSIDSAAISSDAPAPTIEKSQSSSDTTLGGDQCEQPQLTPDQATLTYSRSPIDIDILSSYACHRTNTSDTNVTKHQHKRVLLLKREALFNPDFRSTLGHSLVECIADPRRYSYLKHFFKNYRSPKEVELHERIETGKQVNGDDFNGDINSSTNQNKLLNLYLEMNKFHDALTVCSASGRDKLLMYARAISARFLTEDNGVNYHAQENYLPEHVAHIALGGVEKVQAVRFALSDEDEFFEVSGDGDGFHSVRLSLEAFISTQESFLSFLISDDCARMRAYLRGSSPFVRVEPQLFLKTGADDADSSYTNYLLYAIIHTVCMKESKESNDSEENFIKNDAWLLSSGKRNLGAASLLGCAFYIMRSLQNSMDAAMEGLIEDGMTGESNNLPLYSAFIENLQFFWEVYIAPASGALSSLSLSQDAQDSLDDVRRLLVSSVDDVLGKKLTPADAMNANIAMTKVLSSVDVASSVHRLAEALLREYTLKIYPNFRRHIFHEWACKEAIISYTGKEHLVSSEFNGLLRGCLNRLFRQMDLPHGLSLHRRPILGTPSQRDDGGTSSPALDDTNFLHGGDAALVFGSEVGDKVPIRRFSCVSLLPEEYGPRDNVILPGDIPLIFESYAEVPPFHERPFQGILQDRISLDGWEVSLTNFVIPSKAKGDSVDDKWMYCVSLVFRKSSMARPQINERDIDEQCVRELQHNELVREVDGSKFQSPLFTTCSHDGRSRTRSMKVSQALKQFNSKLQEQKWSQQASQGVIGIALISRRNVTHAMRETLSLLYGDFCSVKGDGHEDEISRNHVCQPLVDILGVFTHSQDVEASSLSCLLQPYHAYTTSRWVHRPLSDQTDIFSKSSGMQLLQTLPPVPLALAFITILLEQKVLFVSSRRGMLTAASFGMLQLLRPLTWAHLQVPLVPVSMMNELIHYPAPFMLGFPTDEKDSVAVLNSLPTDVTLVDLDVGRVILASKFANDKNVQGGNDEVAAGALRSQVLFLAETVGGQFGAAIYRNSWFSDSPFQSIPNNRSMQGDDSFSEILNICGEFISELLSGLHSCCLWVEEKQSHEEASNSCNESAIIFDEDRFYSIKHLRAEGRYMPLIPTETRTFSLGLHHFDLIFEAFLRTQCLSTYICDAKKESMLFWN